MKLVSIALVLLVTGSAMSGCSGVAGLGVAGALLIGGKLPSLSPRAIEPPTHCEVAKSAGRSCLEPAAATAQEPI